MYELLALLKSENEVRLHCVENGQTKKKISKLQKNVSKLQTFVN